MKLELLFFNGEMKKRICWENCQQNNGVSLKNKKNIESEREPPKIDRLYLFSQLDNLKEYL